MLELFAANSLILDGVHNLDFGGITEISAPESTKNDRFEIRS